MASKVGDVVERSVSTLVQAGTGVAAVLALGVPTWLAAPIAAVLAVVKNGLTKAAPVVEKVAEDVAKVAPTVGAVAAEVAQGAGEVESALHAG